MRAKCLLDDFLRSEGIMLIALDRLRPKQKRKVEALEPQAREIISRIHGGRRIFHAPSREAFYVALGAFTSDDLDFLRRGKMLEAGKEHIRTRVAEIVEALKEELTSNFDQIASIFPKAAAFVVTPDAVDCIRRGRLMRARRIIDEKLRRFVEISREELTSDFEGFSLILRIVVVSVFMSNIVEYVGSNKRTGARKIIFEKLDNVVKYLKEQLTGDSQRIENFLQDSLNFADRLMYINELPVLGSGQESFQGNPTGNPGPEKNKEREKLEERNNKIRSKKTHLMLVNPRDSASTGRLAEEYRLSKRQIRRILGISK